jgi:hypothetical protein
VRLVTVAKGAEGCFRPSRQRPSDFAPLGASSTTVSAARVAEIMSAQRQSNEGRWWLAGLVLAASDAVVQVRTMDTCQTVEAFTILV